MTICELVVSNSLGCEIGRFELNRDSNHGFINLLSGQSDDVMSTLQNLDAGDTFAIVERWTEAD